MSEWTDLVKKLCKENPGKPLGAILPLAKKMYKIHGFCFECTVDMEAGLRRAGLYQEYEKQMMQGNMQGWAEGLQQWMIEQLGESISFVTEDGTVEDWGNNPARQKAEIIKNVNQYLDHLKKHLE